MGVVVLLVAGMGLALATTPAAAQTSDESTFGSWFDDDESDDGVEQTETNDDQSDGWNSDDGDSNDGDSDDGQSDGSGTGDWYDDDDGEQTPDDGEQTPDDGDDGTTGAAVQSASATVTDATIFSGRVQEVTFTFTATEGDTVTLTAGDSSARVQATGAQQQATVQTGGMFWGVTPPVDVSASAGATECTASVAEEGQSTQLCEGQDPTPEPTPDFGVSVDSAASVTEGETITVDATVQNTGDGTGTQTVTVSVGDQSTTESVTLGPGESTTVALTWQTQGGDAGDYQATVSTDGDTSSTTVSVSEQVPPANFQVADLSTTGPVTEGDALTVEASVQNPGGQAGTTDVTVSVGSESTTESVNLDAGESTTVSLTWQTATGDSGDYQASASTADDSASTGVSVTEQAAPANFQVADVSTNGPVTAGDALTVEATVQNSGEQSGTQDVTVSVGSESTTDSVTLAGGDSATVTLTWQTAADDAGDYQASASTADDSGSMSVSVSEQATPANFQVTGVSAADVTEGDGLSVDATVENTGDLEGTQTVDLSAGDLGSDSQSVTLAGGASTSVSLSVDTSEGDAGTFTAEVSSDDDSGSATVTVEELVTDGSVTGTVTDESGAAVSDATVSAGGTSATTASDGSYSLTLTEGSYDLTVEASGYQTATESVSVTAGATSTVDVTLTETPDPASFQISDVSANAPAIGEEISIEATIQNTGDTEATQTVTLNAPGGAAPTRQVTLTGGESTTVTLSAPGVPNAGTFTAQVMTEDASATTSVDVRSTTGTVSGTVTDGSGSAISGATVSAGGSSTTTDASGSYSMTLDSGSYTVQASADGYETATQSVTVSAGSSTSADLALSESQSTEPQEFTAYVRGDGGFLHMNTSASGSSPILFPECADGEPTDSALSRTPDHLPAPTCVTIEGTYNPSDNTWSGSIDFPQMVSEVPPPAGGAGPGEVYIATEIQADSASGTLNRETGEMTLESDAAVDVAIYNVSSHGVQFDPNSLPEMTDSACQVQSVGLSASTSATLESNSPATGSATVPGQALNDSNVAYLVGDEFAASGAANCGNILGTPLSNLINGMLGLPSESNNELAMDVEVQFAN